ncbi:hypothetical protein DAEQUDRAFT_436948 [Daedalea quercina L-15889]|uniref:Uncharacterized protein n=1 Tax=Daedalea quercina L-15889 TaxID=1314783 RepID=A0A165NAK8_9APHY|nr:hypothetical protein DAEQUDRAFT_436948 [Daedalea quercina L-15889]
MERPSPLCIDPGTCGSPGAHMVSSSNTTNGEAYARQVQGMSTPQRWRARTRARGGCSWKGICYPIFRFDGSEDEDVALSERKQQAAREVRFEEWLSSTPERMAPLVSYDLTVDEEHIVDNVFDFNKWEEDCNSGASSSRVTVDALVTRESRTGEKRKREKSSDEDCTSPTLDCLTRRIRAAPQSHSRNRDYLEYTCSCCRERHLLF